MRLNSYFCVRLLTEYMQLMAYLCKKNFVMKYIHSLTLCTLLLMMMLPLAVQAQERLLVFTDPHLLSPALVVNPGQPYTDAVNSNNKMFDLSAPIMQAMVDTILAIRPTAVLVSGDLSKDGERRSHQDMAAYLSQVRQAGIGVYVIPGNHDANSDEARGYYGSSTRKVPTPNSTEFATIYADMGYNQALERDNNSLSYLAEPIPGLWLIAVDDNMTVQRDANRSIEANGISLSTRNWILAKADQGRSMGKQVIVMMHHQLVEHFDDQDRLVGDATVTDAATLRQELINHGIRLVLTGHMHIGNITTQFNDARTDSLVEVTTGSPLTYPCQFRLIDVAPDRGTFGISTGQLEHIQDIPDLQAYALERFKGSTRSTVASVVYHSWDELMAAINQYSSYIGEVNFTQEQATEAIYNAFKDEIERLMVALAQGNEPTRNVQGLKSAMLNKVGTLVDQLLPNLNFLARLVVVPMIQSQLESMLGKALDSILADCNHYGTSLAHVTDDLTPVLHFPPIDVSKPGDINGDGTLDVTDVNIIINILLGKDSAEHYSGNCDLNSDHTIDVVDANIAINLMLSKR